jgi:ABC-type phosphate transport system permease subunit
MAWGAALVLVLLVLVFNLAGQGLSWHFGRHKQR